MQVPAESITASVPQVGSSVDTEGNDREGAGIAPAHACREPLRSPTHWSSMPPVPKVALASPGRVQP